MTYFLLIPLLFVAISLYFVYRLYGKPTKNVLLETTLTDEHLVDDSVKEAVAYYFKQLQRTCFAFIILLRPLLFIPYDSLILLYTFVWIISFTVCIHLVLIANIRRMRELKATKKWTAGFEANSIRRIDTQLSLKKNQKMLSPFWFTVPILILVVQLFLTLIRKVPSPFIIVDLVLVVTLGLMVFSYQQIKASPAKVLTQDPEVNQYCNDVMKRSWSFIIVSTTYLLGAIQFLMQSVIYASSTLSIVMNYTLIITTLLYVMLIIRSLFLARAKLNKALAPAQKYYTASADKFWQYGIYINPENPTFMIQDRIGMNMSMNFGKRMNQIFLVVLFIPILGLMTWLSVRLIQADFSQTSFKIEIASDAVTLSAPFASTTKISYDDIKDISLIDKLPPAIKVFGTATTHYALGTFKLKGEKETSELFVDTRSNKIIKIKTDKDTYYFSERDSKVTKDAYDKTKIALEK